MKDSANFNIFFILIKIIIIFARSKNVRISNLKIMKRNLLLCILMLTCCGLNAQKYSPMRAYNLFFEKDYVAAKECIDLCIGDEKYNLKANTWLYKANIYYRLASEEYSKKQQDTSYHIQFPTAPQGAYEAFKKAAEINKNIEASEMFSPADALPRLYPLLFIEGVNEIIAARFEAAKPILEMAIASYEMQTPEFPLEGELYYYLAYTLEMLNLPADAQKYYEKAINDNSQNINVFVRLIESYKKDNKRDAVLQLINKGKQKNPNNADILVAEVDYYYWINDKVKGKQLLNNLPQSVYNSTDAIVNIANIYIKDSCFVDAEALLKKAYQRMAGNYIIAHNLGVCCDNIGNAKYMEANKLDLSGKKDDASRVKAQADDYLNRAATYFETALQHAPGDITLLRKLKEIYTRLMQDEKIKQIDSRIQVLEK